VGSIAHRLGGLDALYENGHRVLKDVKLYEVSLVSMPMNPQARVVSVKSAAAEEIRDAIAFERFLKGHGFANSLARRLAAGWNQAIGRRDDDEAIRQLSDLLRKSAKAGSPRTSLTNFPCSKATR
jgi:hypothetical protein